MRIVVLFSLVACAENQDAKDFYDHAESGTYWQLAFRDGMPDGANTCPVFATRTVHVPMMDGSGCDPGCTCSFGFGLIDKGFITGNYYLQAGFDQQCEDGSSISCYDGNPENGLPGMCNWFAHTGDSDSASCSYELDVVER